MVAPEQVAAIEKQVLYPRRRTQQALSHAGGVQTKGIARASSSACGLLQFSSGKLGSAERVA